MEIRRNSNGIYLAPLEHAPMSIGVALDLIAKPFSLSSRNSILSLLPKSQAGGHDFIFCSGAQKAIR